MNTEYIHHSLDDVSVKDDLLFINADIIVSVDMNESTMEYYWEIASVETWTIAGLSEDAEKVGFEVTAVDVRQACKEYIDRFIDIYDLYSDWKLHKLEGNN